MEKNEETITRIVMNDILEDLKTACFNADEKEFNSLIEKLKEEFDYYKTLN